MCSYNYYYNVIFLRYKMKFILFITLLGTFGCYSDDLAEQHCHIVLKEVKNQSGVTVDTYVFWSDCPEYQTN